jgi:hypothetical protein
MMVLVLSSPCWGAASACAHMPPCVGHMPATCQVATNAYQAPLDMPSAVVCCVVLNTVVCAPGYEGPDCSGACGPSYYSPGGAGAECTLCGANTYSNTTAAAACTACESGTSVLGANQPDCSSEFSLMWKSQLCGLHQLLYALSSMTTATQCQSVCVLTMCIVRHFLGLS